MRGTARSDTVSVPPSGVSAPVMIRMSVDFPAPFSPTSAWSSPARRSKETPRSALTPAKDLEIEEATSRNLQFKIVNSARLPGEPQAELRGAAVVSRGDGADCRVG